MLRADHRTPVTVVTGFLGSGKTSLLRRVLAMEAAQGVAVLMNELADTSIDDKVIAEVAGDVRLLKNGCICCVVREDLRKSLMDLLRLATGRPISRVVIETSGMADAAPIVMTFAADPVLRFHFRIARIITTVDCVNASSQIGAYREFDGQVAAADHVILTKSDIAAADSIEAARNAVARLNPAVPSSMSSIDDAELARHFFDPGTGIDEAERFRRLFLAALPRSNPLRAEMRSAQHSRTEVLPICIRVPGALDWSAFALWLTMLLHAHGEDVLRVKGLLNVRGSDTPLLINGVKRLIHSPRHLERWPGEDHTSLLVLIVRGLALERITRSFEHFVGATSDGDGEATADADEGECMDE